MDPEVGFFWDPWIRSSVFSTVPASGSMDRCLWIQEGEDDVRTGGEGKGFLRFFLNSGFTKYHLLCFFTFP